MTYFISPGPISSLTLPVFVATLKRDLVANARAATRRMTASEPGHGACQDTSRGSDKRALRTRVACHCRIPHSWPDKYVCLNVCISVSLCVCASVTVCEPRRLSYQWRRHIKRQIYPKGGGTQAPRWPISVEQLKLQRCSQGCTAG